MTTQHDNARTLTLTSARRIHIGWSGSNHAMYELRAPCGCAFSDDGKSLVRVCTHHLCDRSVSNIRLAADAQVQP